MSVRRAPTHPQFETVRNRRETTALGFYQKILTGETILAQIVSRLSPASVKSNKKIVSQIQNSINSTLYLLNYIFDLYYFIYLFLSLTFDHVLFERLQLQRQ